MTTKTAPPFSKTILLPAWILAGIFLVCLPGKQVQAQLANHKRPVLEYDMFFSGGVSRGMVPEQLFWEHVPHKSDPDALEKWRQRYDEAREEDKIPIMSIMMWGGTFYRSEPGTGRIYSDKPGFTQYWEWNNARMHYFSKRADGRYWAHGYEEDGTPKDAWITPSRPLDEKDRKEGIETYGDWYADRVASCIDKAGLSGYIAADHVDNLPDDGSVLVQDFSEPIIKDFERWSGIGVEGSNCEEWAEYIKDNCFSTWVDYHCEVYAKWWLDIVKEAEKRTGRKIILSLQKHTYPHQRRYHAADIVFMREQAERADQIYYHVENWSIPHSRGIGRGEISSHVATLCMHLCKQPDIIRGCYVPTSDFESYPEGNKRGTDIYAAIDRHLRHDRGDMNMPAEKKTEMAHKLMEGGWMALGWAHLAVNSGDVERTAMYFKFNATKYIPEQLYEEVILEHYPVKPFGPGFYYTTSLEKKYEQTLEIWNPVKKVGANARGNAKGNFFPGYYVSDQVLENLKPAAYPTCWITDDIDAIPEQELSMLEAIAPVYDVDEPDKVPASLTPVRFEGDVTGYAFVDQHDKVIVVATRDHVLNENDITARMRLQGIPDGTYQAENLVSGKTYDVRISRGKGDFSFPLSRWETKSFVLNIPPGLTK